MKKDYLVKKSNTGLGLFANRDFKKGEFIIEYIGERMTPEEANKKGGMYLFEINSKETVDGKDRKNIARYINHSCLPNSEVEIKNKRILIYTKKAVKNGEEFNYDYGKEYFDEFIKPHGCKCKKCSKILVENPKTNKEK